MYTIVKALFSLVLSPLLVPLDQSARDATAKAPKDDDEPDLTESLFTASKANSSALDKSSGARVMSSALSNSTRSAGATTPDDTTLTETTASRSPYLLLANANEQQRRSAAKMEAKKKNKKYAEEPFLMRLRKITIAMLFIAVILALGVGAGMLVFTHTLSLSNNIGVGVHMVIGGMFGFVSVWTATYFRVAWTKQSTDGVVHFMLIGTIAVDVMINIGSINYISTPTEVTFLVAFILLLQVPHALLYFVFLSVFTLWRAYNEVALDVGWMTLTIPRPYTYDDFTVVDTVLRIPGTVGMMVFVMFLLYLQAEENKRQLRTAESAVKVAAAVAERLGAYDTIGASVALRTGKAEKGRHFRDDGSASGAESARQTNKSGEFSAQPSGLFSPTTSRLVRGDQTTASSVVEAVELDPKLLDAFQRLLVNLDAYRPYLPNWLLHSETSGDEIEEERPRRPSKLSGGGVAGKNSAASLQPQDLDSPVSVSIKSPQNMSGADLRARSVQTQKPNATVSMPHATFAVLEFWLDPETPASQTECDLATAQFIELVLKEANAAKAAVHYSALGEILLSWNVCRSDPAPEAKAARFLNEVQSCLSAAKDLAATQQSPASSIASVSTERGANKLRSPARGDDKWKASFRWQSTALHLMRAAGAAVTGTIRTGEFGSTQRHRVVYAASLKSRLYALSKLSRQLLLSNGSGENAPYDFKSTSMISLLDIATCTQAEHSFHIAHAGAVVVHSRRDAHKEAKASLLSSAEVPSTEQHQIFQLMGTRQSDDEWLYAMAEGAVDVWSDAWRKAYGRTLKMLQSTTPPMRNILPWMRESDSLQSTPQLPALALARVPSCLGPRQQPGDVSDGGDATPHRFQQPQTMSAGWGATPPGQAAISDRRILSVFDQQPMPGGANPLGTSPTNVAGVVALHSDDTNPALTPPCDVAIAELPEYCLVPISAEAAAEIQSAIARVDPMEGSSVLKESAATRALRESIDKKMLIVYMTTV